MSRFLASFAKLAWFATKLAIAGWLAVWGAALLAAVALGVAPEGDELLAGFIGAFLLLFAIWLMTSDRAFKTLLVIGAAVLGVLHFNSSRRRQEELRKQARRR